MSGQATIYYEPSSANCSGRDYSKSDINAAAEKALQLSEAHRTLGRDKYPHVYNDYEHFNFPHAQKPYFEFPILPGGEVYDGGQPETDRIVIGSVAEDFSSAVYCGLITHSGESHNGFAMCRDDSMNVRGQGNEIHPQGHGRDRHGRRTLDRYEM